MSDQDDSSKTEEPSQKRLDESRKKGQVVQSRDVGSLIMLGAGALVVLGISPWMMGRLLQTARVFLERPNDFSLETPGTTLIFQEILLALSFTLLVPLIILLIAAYVSGVVQFGLLFAMDKLGFKWEQVSLIKGFGRMFSMRNVVEFLKGVAKISLVGVACFMIIWPELSHIERLVISPVQIILPTLGAMTFKLTVVVLAVLAVLAAGDYLYQRYAHLKQLRMTKQEVKDEHKQAEGDPHIKSKLRQIRNQRARKRMMANVPKATVVVTNPTHYSVALKYDASMGAPKVVAKGLDAVALRIRELAREHRVPIVANPPLARSLHAAVEIDQEIPGEHYKAVAEVISFVMRANRRPNGPAGGGPVGGVAAGMGPAGGASAAGGPAVGAGGAGGRPSGPG